jgi:glycerol uptake facilitator protein
MTPFLAEVLGTMLLILMGNGVVANVLLTGTKGNNSGFLAITIGWGMAVFIAVVVAGPYSGAHLNPAVSVGLAVAGKFSWSQVGPYVVAQFLGAFIGATLVWLSYKDHYDSTSDAGLKLATFCNTPAIANPIMNILTEAVGTFVLLFGVLFITGPEWSSSSMSDVKIGLGSVGALPVALMVVGIGLSLGGPTGYAINPARDLGPRIMHALLPISRKGDSGWGYAWVPVVGPLLGAVLAAGLYLGLG